ncbi:hypothetical protein SAMN05216343_10234 [Oscillibacter sp. PC13]|uniref:hypothetical protein n=1 Tax=Oscillibacter sp. PC13 TaxID=1855299 RepID=UPI0008ED7697|nr:hypothetical protein [Oscillibacter sp. PC13]SFP01734.1 hypothetical protein SAMN05216343_10234 [Oscillibacter sp. PC13]
MRRKKQNRRSSLLPGLLLPAVSMAVLLCFITALTNLKSGQEAEGKRQLENAIRQAAVACYAVEGIYPPDLTYLEEYYGIQMDGKRYTVYYDVFASNLMPDITVLENET